MKMVVGSLRSVSLKRLTKISTPLLIAIAIIFNILAPLFALSWSQQPFLGVLFYPRLVVSDLYNPAWNARQQGLQSADVLRGVDSTPISSGRDLFILLRQKQTNDAVTLDLERAPWLPDNAPNKISVFLTAFAWRDLFNFFWFPYIIGVTYLALGIIVYRLRGVDYIGQVFALLCVFVSIFAGGLFDQHSLHLLSFMWAFAWPLMGAGLLHLASIFPVENPLIRGKLWLNAIPYLLAVILGAVNLYSFYFAPNPRLHLSLRPWNFGFLGLALLLFFSLVLSTRAFSLSMLVRQQTAIVFGGSFISFGPATVWAIGNVLNFNWSLSGPISILVFAPLLIFPITIAYAALRYHLLDLDIVFSRGGVYALLLLLVIAVYFLIVSVLGALLQDTTFFQNPIFLTIFVLALVIFLEPMRQRLQAVVNRFFLPEPFDSRQPLQQYSRDLISTPLDTDLILQMLLKQVDQTLAPEHTLVFLRDYAHNIYAIRHQLGRNNPQIIEVRFGLHDDLAQWLAETNDILQLDPAGEVPLNINIAREELARLRILNVTLCVPLLGSDYLLGWLGMGAKKSGQPYNSNDLIFLATLASQTTIALENAQLLEQANRRAAELEALQKISAEIQGEVEPDRLLTSVVQQATRLLNAEGGLVYLLEPDEKTLKVVVSYNLNQDYTGYAVKIDEGVAGQVLTSEAPVVIDNYLHFSGRSPKFQNAKFGAVLGVPLRWGGKVQGVLVLVHHPHGLRFSQNDVWLMEFFATQAAIALEKSRLLHEARQRAEQLTILSEVSMAISSTLNLDTALQRVMDRAVQILHAEAGSLLLMDPKGKELIFKVVKGPTESELLGMKTPVGTGIAGTVAQMGEALIVNDVATDPRWNVAFDEATDFHTKDILCVPMITHQQVVGVIEVINKQDGTVFNHEEAQLLMSFAAQAAIAIENAQIFESTDKALAERVQELQTIQMFEQELQTSLELSTVLDLTLSRIMDSLGVVIGLMGIIKGEEEPGLYLLVQRGMPTEMGRYKRDPWPLTKGVIGRVARTGELAWVNDITQEKDYVPKNHRTRSLLIVPVLREGRVIGVVDLESTESDYFSSDDVSFVKLLVSHAAIAIENAQLFDRVKEANEAKTIFMNTASHELKIPMTSIKGYAKLLQMGAGGALTDQQADFLKVISNNVDRMTQLVNDLLDVSRIEAGRIRLEIEDVQIQDVIDEVIRSVQNQIENKHLNLTVDVDANLPELRADYNRMVQIVTNLVSNAYKYTPEGGDISVIARPYSNGDIQGISVSINDTGYGISEEDQAKLFTTFFRSSDQNIRDAPGTGLGLMITKKMVESHGGELTFVSELGKGTSFTFTMPLVCKIPPGVEVIER